MGRSLTISVIVSAAALAVGVVDAPAASVGAGVEQSTKDGCTATIGKAVEVLGPRFDYGLAKMSVACKRPQRRVHLAVTVEKFVPDVWVGASELRTSNLPADRTVVFYGHEPCVPGTSAPFRARASVVFTDHDRTVRIMTRYTTSTLACG
jgi:hypothetical protein